MAQFARPKADVTLGGWTDQSLGTTNIYTTIDEVTPDDNDFIRSATAPASDVYVTSLEEIEDPGVNTGHVIRYRYAKTAAGGAAVNLTIQLRQDYVNEGSPGTLITEDIKNDISDTVTAGTINLSEGEAELITDYTSLYLRFVANQP